MRKSLSEYLNTPYQFNIQPGSDGSFFIEFPDLPGCMTQVDTPEEIVSAAQEIKELWIETAFDLGRDIPLPATEYSGKFMTRIGKSLHRDLAMAARREKMSLNSYVQMLLAQGYILDDLKKHCTRIEQSIELVHDKLPEDTYRVSKPAHKQAIPQFDAYEFAVAA